MPNDVLTTGYPSAAALLKLVLIDDVDPKAGRRTALRGYSYDGQTVFANFAAVRPRACRQESGGTSSTIRNNRKMSPRHLFLNSSRLGSDILPGTKSFFFEQGFLTHEKFTIAMMPRMHRVLP